MTLSPHHWKGQMSKNCQPNKQKLLASKYHTNSGNFCCEYLVSNKCRNIFFIFVFFMPFGVDAPFKHLKLWQIWTTFVEKFRLHPISSHENLNWTCLFSGWSFRLNLVVTIAEIVCTLNLSTKYQLLNSTKICCYFVMSVYRFRNMGCTTGKINYVLCTRYCKLCDV